jgi:hypothetical protein
MENKMTCVFGCQIGTKAGKAIKAEMLKWLLPNFDVHIVDVGLDCKNEFPFIATTIMQCIQGMKPVLYIHTKGACNPISKAFELNKKTGVIVPELATPFDSQRIVRAMWKHEFTTNIAAYLNAVSTKEPVVACPYTNSVKTTWHNGFVINPYAAYVLTKTFHDATNRYYFEKMFSNTDINVVGVRMNNVERGNYSQQNMWQDLWDNFYPLGVK